MPFTNKKGVKTNKCKKKWLINVSFPDKYKNVCGISAKNIRRWYRLNWLPYVERRMCALRTNPYYTEKYSEIFPERGHQAVYGGAKDVEAVGDEASARSKNIVTNKCTLISLDWTVNSVDHVLAAVVQR